MSFSNYDYEYDSELEFDQDPTGKTRSKRFGQRAAVTKNPQKRHAKLQPERKAKYRNWLLNEED